MPPQLQEMTRDELIGVVSSLYHEVQTLKKLIYGARSERFIADTANPDQGTLGFGEQVEPQKEEPEKQTITYEREKTSSKKAAVRQPIPEHLVRIVHQILPEEEVTGLVKIGEEVTEELEYTPDKLFVNRYVRPKYIKPEGATTKVLIGKLPERPLPKCIAGPTLLAALIIAKFIDHLPLYR